MSLEFPQNQDPFSRAQGGAAKQRAPRTWIGFLVGALVTLAGVGMIFWPLTSATWVLGALVGAACVANGVGLLLRGGPAVLGGALLTLLGILAFLMPDAVAGALVTFAGVGFLVLGIIVLVVVRRFTSVRRATGSKGLGSVAGLVPGVLLVGGGFVALMWPDLALGVVAVIGGLCLVALGALIIWITRKIRRGGPASQTTIII